MRLITNEKLITRNAAIGKYSATAGLVILIGGLLVSLFKQGPEYQLIPFYTLIIGFILSNVGIYYSNRFVRAPRPDQSLEGALKGMDDRYILYHYRLPTPHVLVCPSGVYALVPKFQSGELLWDGKRWKHKGANIFLSLFGQEGLGNPNAEAASDVETLAKFLAKKVDGDIPPTQAIIVFYNPKAVIEAKDAPIPAMHVKQFKEYLRKLPKGPTLSPEQISALNTALGV